MKTKDEVIDHLTWLLTLQEALEEFEKEHTLNIKGKIFQTQIIGRIDGIMWTFGFDEEIDKIFQDAVCGSFSPSEDMKKRAKKAINSDFFKLDYKQIIYTDITK